jgi:WD40 repeat protein
MGNENISKLILNNLYLNEILLLQYTCKQTFLLSYIINRISQLKQNRLYCRFEDKVGVIYDHFRYSEGFQTKCHLNFITFANQNSLACKFQDGGVSLYDMCLNTQKEIKSFHLPNSPISLITFKDGLFATLNYDNNIRVFNINKPSDFICIKSNGDIKKLILKDKDNLIVCKYTEIVKYDIGFERLTNKFPKLLKLEGEVLHECPNLLDIFMHENILLFSHSKGFGIYDISNKYLKSNVMHTSADTITILNQNRFVGFYSSCLKIWDINKNSIIAEFPFRSNYITINCAIVFNDNVLIYVTKSHILNGYDITKNNLLFQCSDYPDINLILKYDENYFITTNRSGYIKFWDIRNMGLCKNLDIVYKCEGVIV